MQSVARLLKHGAGRAFDHIGSDFLAAMGWQAVHYLAVLGRPCQEGAVDLVWSKLLQALIALRFLVHAGPDVRVDHVRGFYGSGRLAHLGWQLTANVLAVALREN